MTWCQVLLLCVFLYQITDAFHIETVAVDDVFNILIPTLISTNAKCRNHSIFYMRELRKLKLWATEMFDASSKFPSGVLFGSNYNFGNFDECVEVKVPVTKEKVVGRYCMAKFHLTPPDFRKSASGQTYYGEVNFFNASTWDKIVAFSDDRARKTRNDFYFSYCIPSSCQYDDLQTSLKVITEKINSLSSFKLTATVDPLHCQLKNELTFGTADIIFISIIMIFALIAIIATLYDWLIKEDEFRKLKLAGIKHEIVMSFSVWANLKKLAHDGENGDGLQCIHGLKVISMFHIIMGHRIMFQVGSPIVNPNFVENMYGKVEAAVLLNGPIIVDTFFNISGFLGSYLLLQNFEKIKRGSSFLVLYIHRFIRLTPAYAVVIAFYCTLFFKTGSGPFWEQRVGIEQDRCIASWWANLLYLNNYINKDQICMFQSWYLTCDMHLFLIAPIIVWLLRKKPLLGLGTLFILIILSISIVFATVYLSNEDAILLLYMKFLKDPVVNNTFKNVYIPTHMRASPYFVGMVTGYIKYKIRITNYKIPKYIVYTGWFMCVFVIEATVYSAFIFYIPGKPYDPVLSGIYASIHHFTWSICISWMIIAVSEGHSLLLQPILCWKPFILLSRITYTAFLCHGAIQIYTAATLRNATYASIFNLVYQTAGDIALAYIGGLILSMLFEAPILALEKSILKKDIKNIKEDKSKGCCVVTPKIKIINQF